jgi:hypothetical protein
LRATAATAVAATAVAATAMMVALAAAFAGCGRTVVGEARCADGRVPAPEVCDGVDNDCDWQVDEEDPATGARCDPGLPGVCAGGGAVVCRDGALACDLAVTPSPETCNGLDDDCDGPVDEDDPGGGSACATGLPGVCADGATRCASPALVCEPVTPAAPELCNVLDDDCDGAIDEDNPGGGAACFSGMPGICAPGTVTCTFGLLLCLPSLGPAPEVCNALDDDCDGATDEGNPGGGAPCPTGLPGVCGTGAVACSGGALACQQTVFPGIEACNALDDDCDGTADEGDPGGGVACATGMPGVCAPGTTHCQAGAIACLPNVAPAPEVCNTLDDDCDGTPDDGNPGGGAPCDTGLPGLCAAGTITCVVGVFECLADALGDPELCNGVDDDCDGAPDDGDPGGGFACDTGELGVCAAGTTHCEAATVVCQRDTDPSEEVCNGLDDDCDGTPDDGAPGAGVPCSTGLGGQCDPGHTQCDPGGMIVCAADAGVPETCNGLDDDCDALVDDGLPTFECGTCDPDCHRITLTGPFPLPGGPLPVETDGVSLDPAGNLVLDSTTIEFHYAWIANYQEGTVSKVDTDTGAEVGRFDSVRLLDVPTARPAHEACDWVSTGNCPSRTAVDLFGNVWVANRAFGSQGTASKIANLPADCIDRNGNGVIDTSTDWDMSGTIEPDCDGNGVFDTLTTVCTGGGPPEFIGQDDECILFSVNVGGVDSVPRALSIEPGTGPTDPGDVWIGAFNEGAFYKFDGATGTQLVRVPAFGSAGIAPYGSVLDAAGTLWAVNNCCDNGGIRPLDTATNTFGALRVKPASLGAGVCDGGPPGQYGIAVDGAGRIWLGGWPCNAAFVYDPAADTWARIDALNPGYGGRGIAVDGFGQVWMAMHLGDFTGARVVRLDGASLTWLGTYDMTPLGVDVPVGVGVDFNGSIWTVNQSSSSAVRVHVDPVTGVPSPHPVTGNVMDEFPVGLEPYTYSDFTGFGLRTFTAPSGTYAFTVEGCALGAPADWDYVSFLATTPPGTSVLISVRAGDDLATIDAQPSFGDWSASPAELTLPPGPVPSSRYLKVTVRLLSADEIATPTVSNVVVQWTCM